MKNQKFSEKEKQLESIEILKKHPNTVPVIIEQHPKSSLEGLEKRKFLISIHFNMSHLISIIRKRMKLNKYDALYLFVNKNNLLKADESIIDVYNNYKDTDGFLYIQYSEYNSFGLLSINDFAF